jgi:leader peptidase (prepilin peptidase)/N-methyltransferase
VELVTALAFVLQGVAAGDDPPLLAVRIVFTALLVALFGTDLETQRLPDALTLSGIGLGLAASLLVPPGWLDRLAGVGLGAAMLLAIRWLWQRLRGVDAMGLGDVKMLAMIGAFLGWRQVLVVMFFATLAGAVVGVAVTLARGARTLQVRLPFGTFLAVAAYAASMAGEPLLDWYLGLYR